MLIGLIVIGIKGIRTVFTPIVERKARFALSDDVGGLRIGDDVRLGGFKVGVIRHIDVVGLDDGQEPGIIITFSMPASYPLHQSAHLAVQGTLTGSTWLNIDNLGAGPVLAQGEEIPGHPSATTELLASLGGAAPDLRGLLHDVHTVTVPKVNTSIDKAGDTLTSIHHFADRGAVMADQVGELFGDTKPDIRGTMKNLNAITGSAKEKIPGILDHVDVALAKVSSTIDSAKAAMEDIKTAAANTKDLTGSAKGIISNNRGKFDGMIASLKATADNLKGASADIRRSPWRLLYKPAPGEVENLTLFDAARQFSDGANNVNDAALALRDATQNPGVDREQVQKMVDKLNETFANFHEVEQKLWTAVKE